VTGEGDHRLEEGGGWRLISRGGAPPSLGRGPPVENLARLVRSPRAALARAFALAKAGRVGDARRQVDLVRIALGGPRAREPDIEADLTLVDLHVRIYAGEPLSAEDARRLREVGATLPAADAAGQALAENHLSSVMLHLGRFDAAQQHAETAMKLFRTDGAEFGSLHLHTHLGQIRLMRGDLEGAEREYRAMEEGLARLGDPASTALDAAGRALRAEVAYERGDLAAAHGLLGEALPGLEENDAWLDVLAAAYRVNVRLAFIDAGLPGALDALGRARRVAALRGMPRLDRLMRIEHVRALTLSDEIDAARAEMREIGLDTAQPDWDDAADWAQRQGTTFVAIARWMVRARRAREAVVLLASAEDFAIQGGQLLALAKLRVVRACAQWRLREPGEATRTLLSAVRLLGRQPFRRFILDEGSAARPVVQAALDGAHARTPLTPEQRRRLTDLMHAWTTETSHPSRASRSSTGALAKMGERGRYLELLAHGLSNKEIARIGGVSVNTVKYHLKALFADLHVENRTRAVHRARELGLLE
jgi:ATP/maltotriose-dependent transcriptional regulator MalT